MAIRLTPELQRRLALRHLERLKRCVPWNPAMKWQHELDIQGRTYRVLELWPGIAASAEPVDSLQPGQFVDSPTRRFRYCVRLHARGHAMLTWWGNQTGTVVFDDDVIIPALYQARDPDAPGTGHWNEMPWMSITPGEIMTLRPGTRMAKGKVIVAGLGLGHQLIEVSKRLQVKRIVLVELDRELVDWILPVIRPHVKKPLEVLVGDAYEIIPKLSADVALIDIFPGYGDGFRRVAELRRRSPNIRKFWGWGTSEMSGLAQRER